MADDPIPKGKQRQRWKPEILVEKSEAQKREAKNSRTYRLKNVAKLQAMKRKWYLANLEKAAATNKAWSSANADWCKTYRTEYVLRNKVQVANRHRIYQAEHRVEYAARNKARYEKLKSIRVANHDPTRVMRVVRQAVNSGLPKHMRDDIEGEMLLAVFSGELLLEHVGKHVKSYLTDYNRQYDPFKTLSLDAPMGGTDLRRIDLLEAPVAYQPEEEEEEDSDILMLKGTHFRF